MPQFGIIQLAKPRLTVLRGFNPNEPQTRTASAPVGAGVTVWSGQVIYLIWNGTTVEYEWALGCVAGSTPHVALQSSNDEDVISANSLVGLSCSGQFELQTPWYSSGTYNIDVPLTFDGTTGNVIPTTYGSGTVVLGVVTRNRGILNLGGTLSADQTYISGAQDSSAVSENVISFVTHFVPNTVAS